MCVGELARVEVPKIPARFTGTGDLFSSLLLAWRHEGLQVMVGIIYDVCGLVRMLFVLTSQKRSHCYVYVTKLGMLKENCRESDLQQYIYYIIVSAGRWLSFSEN